VFDVRRVGSPIPGLIGARRIKSDELADHSFSRGQAAPSGSNDGWAELTLCLRGPVEKQPLAGLFGLLKSVVFKDADRATRR
jgi:hypothetical protein